MSAINPEVWERLGGSVPRQESLLARRAVPGETDRLLAAVDVEGRRHLLVLLTDQDEALSDRGARGVSAATRELEVPGSELGRYIDLTCLDPAGRNAFDLVGGEIAVGLVDGTMPPAAVVQHVLSKWRRFWGQPPREILSREAQIGLFAELRFLVDWLLPATSPAEASMRWRGPHGSRHDFEWTGRAVEAKGSASVRGAVFQIHGLDQLDPPESGDLLLYGLHLREQGGASLTLPGLVSEALRGVESDDSALASAERCLDRAGYSPHHDDEYGAVAWRVVDEALYPVTGDFPRLGASLLIEGLPAGVREVSYSVDLNGYSGQRFDSPAEAALVLG